MIRRNRKRAKEIMTKREKEGEKEGERVKNIYIKKIASEK